MEEYNASINKPGILHGGQITAPSDRNYGKFILDTLQKYEDKVALIDANTGEKITFKDIAKQMVCVANSLSKIGVEKGDVVAICSENRFEFMITCFAIVSIGAVANFINKSYSKEECVNAVAIAKPKYVFLSPETYVSYYKIFNGLQVVTKFFMFGKPSLRVATTFDELVRTGMEGVDDFKFADVGDGSGAAIITYSSGTTGLPKGVKWTHLGLIVAANQPIATDKDLICLSMAPWTNTMGYMVTTDYIFKGNTVVNIGKFSVEQFLKTIETYKVSFFVGPPPLIVILNKSPIFKNYDVSSLEIVYCGGAPIEASTITEFFKRAKSVKVFAQGYGLSEATGAVSQETANENKRGSVGKVVPGIMVKIVDPETGKVLGPNERGEIRIKGPAIFAGYIGKDMKEDYDEENFYKTGDVAYYDTEGYIFIVDRLKELIKYKAYQVPPSELEAVLLQHPAVKDAGVIGIPDPLAGELPFAFVVKQPGGRVSEKEVINFLASKVSPWKHLRGGVRFVTEIPKNPTGKIMRKDLRKMYKTTLSKL